MILGVGEREKKGSLGRRGGWIRFGGGRLRGMFGILGGWVLLKCKGGEGVRWEEMELEG